MTDKDDTPRVWVGCLGCYNGGALVGEWFDATDAPTEMDEFSPRVFGARGPFGQAPEGHAEEMHEELWVFDHENFAGLLTGECSPAQAREIAEALENAGDRDVLAAFGEYSSVEEFDSVAEYIEAAGERFIAQGDDERDAAWEYLEDSGYFEDLPERFEYHKDAIVRDWLASAQNGGEIHAVRRDGVTYLFAGY